MTQDQPRTAESELNIIQRLLARVYLHRVYAVLYTLPAYVITAGLLWLYVPHIGQFWSLWAAVISLIILQYLLESRDGLNLRAHWRNHLPEQWKEYA